MERSAGWTITGARHAGITVSEMDRSLAFYGDLLGLELLWRRVFEEPEIREIVGVPEASAIEVAMLRVPGSDLDVELLEYRAASRSPVRPLLRATARGTSACSSSRSTSSTRSSSRAGSGSAPTARSR